MSHMGDHDPHEFDVNVDADAEAGFAPGATPPPEGVSALVANHREFLAYVERRIGDRALAEDILQ